MNDVGRRVVSAKRWRWLPGMLILRRFGPRRVVSVEHDWLALDDLMGSGDGVTPADAVPDLRDPATLGCLLALVRDAWGRPGITTKRHPVLGWIVIDGAEDFLKAVACDTEAEALVAALESAP